MGGDPFDDFEASTDRWWIEPYDPERDSPPSDHHAQPDEDPPAPEAA